MVFADLVSSLKKECLECCYLDYHYVLRLRAVRAGKGADQLTLSQPVGQIMPATLLHSPWIFRPSYGPEFKASLSSALQASKM